MGGLLWRGEKGRGKIDGEEWLRCGDGSDGAVGGDRFSESLVIGRGKGHRWGDESVRRSRGG